MSKLLSCVLFVLLLLPLTAQSADIPEPGPKESCPVCGMFVALYPEWIAVVIYDDGEKHYFDGAKDLFKYLLDMDKWAMGRKHAGIKEILLTDYYTLGAAEGRKSFYVIGSDVLGPMGHELIPFAVKEDAEEFLKDHKGKEIISFDMVDLSLLERLDRGDI